MARLNFRYFDFNSKTMLYSDKDFSNLEQYFSAVSFKRSDDMQFTGLKDCNGVDIFEGDIVTQTLNRWSGTGVVEHLANGHYCGFFVRSITEGSIEWVVHNEIYKAHRAGVKVIGNIHENSELLK